MPSEPDLSCVKTDEVVCSDQVNEPMMVFLGRFGCFALVRKSIRLDSISTTIGRETLDVQGTCSSPRALQARRNLANVQSGPHTSHVCP